MAISSLLGFVIGCIPGTGSLVATLLSYGMFKRLSRRGKEYGTGCNEGVMIAESANNATHPGAILTTLVLGIPGEMAMVVLLGAFTIHGLRCGPMLLVNDPTILYVIFLSIMISGLMTLTLAWTTLKGWVKTIETPKAFVWPVVLFLCILGTYSLRSSINDVLLMSILGTFTYFIERSGFSKIPLIMGMVLGPVMEENMRMALQLSAPYEFFTQPISAGLFVILIITCFLFSWVQKPKKVQDDQGGNGT